MDSEGSPSYLWYYKCKSYPDLFLLRISLPPLEIPRGSTPETSKPGAAGGRSTSSQSRCHCKHVTEIGSRQITNKISLDIIYILVGGLEHEFYDFPFSWEFHHPNWLEHIFQRGRYTTNQYIIDSTYYPNKCLHWKLHRCCISCLG